ncbi:2-polyprenyl-6-methoxyphenol hydroxylase [Bradyrhizobium lablabi]|uniref:2-polyprenyl-6-methoxyphenol hydroxylase n=1 Tax=Bradyrhizobium lablabi TaxID=722472 RepID=A0A1M7CT22_9BRAD|nr:squalene monooxygenase [Bradyrhizobium lablabi]SHL70376.1 2-polyprenyl-6-methoxyphenol hydroxylase [Bradyrhizobium lablabi]
MSNFFGRRAVVVGGGIGGLSAAGALAPYFEQVDVLERDRLAAYAESRPGTAQDRHTHGLLAGGLKALGEIFPGFERDLAEAGAVSVGVAQDIRYERADVGALPRRDFGLSILCASRPFIEFVLRRRAMAVANIALRAGCRVTEIVPAHEAAHGVRFDSGSGPSETLEADLVVDASGRGATTLELLDTLGWERPQVTEIGIDLTYTTAVVRIPADAMPDWKLVITLPNPPALGLYAVLVPLEGGRWIVTIADRGSIPRLDNWGSFHAALPQLLTPTIYDALRRAEPLDGIRHYGFPASVWRHFERLPRLPRGALPIADALCRFNPIYGQGMSAAAKQARLLQTVLGLAAAEPDPLLAAQAGFMAGVEAVLQTPWSMSTSADLAFPDTRGERPEDFEKSRQFEAALFRAVVADPVVHRAMIEVGQLLQPHDLLHEPHIKERIDAVSAKAFA